jgi:amidase
VATVRDLSISASLAASTDTPAITAPELSFTCPDSVLCAEAVDERKKRNPATTYDADLAQVIGTPRFLVWKHISALGRCQWSSRSLALRSLVIALPAGREIEFGMPDRSVTRREANQILGAAAATQLLSAQSPDICFLSAVDMAEMIRRKKVSAREVMAAHLKQIERINPKVNAIVTLVAEQATENAATADEAQARGAALGPLHGLPVAHKDLVETAGIRTTFGSLIFKDNVPAHDAIIVERMKKAGAITVGKTNTPEFGAGSQTFNRVFGATKNPYDLTKTCGGSSGGAAVSLACGMVPIADGSDSGGSLRNPSSFCSVVGFRVAPGRVPTAAVGNAWSTLSVTGPMARNVADVALLLSVMAGPDPRCPISISEPGTRFAGNLERSFKGVRVAWFKDLGGIPFDRRIRAAVNAQRKVFEGLGCIVEEAEPDFSGADEAFNTLRALGYLNSQSENVRKHRELVKDTILWEVERGSKLTAADIVRAESLHSQVWDRMRIFQEKYEFFILPATQVPPFDVTQPYVTEIEGVKMNSYIEWMKSCYFISILENPSICLPSGYTPEGLPVGLQIVGRHREEFSVLQLAHAFEQETKSAHRRPPLV